MFHPDTQTLYACNMAGYLASLLKELIYLISFSQIIALPRRVIWGKGVVEREEWISKYVRVKLVLHLNWLEDWNETRVKHFVLKRWTSGNLSNSEKICVLNTAFHKHSFGKNKQFLAYWISQRIILRGKTNHGNLAVFSLASRSISVGSQYVLKSYLHSKWLQPSISNICSTLKNPQELFTVINVITQHARNSEVLLSLADPCEGLLTRHTGAEVQGSRCNGKSHRSTCQEHKEKGVSPVWVLGGLFWMRWWLKSV